MSETGLLSQVFLFVDFNSDELVALAELLRPRRFAAGEVVFLHGDEGTSLYIIDTGRVKLAVSSSDGREAIIDLLGPGDFFGELALLDQEPRSADAIAADPTRLLLLRREDFRRFLGERPALMFALLEVLSRRLRRDAQLLQDAVFLDVPARLARVLLRLAAPDENNNGTPMTPGLTQTDLAGLVGARRESVSKWLNFYEDQGLIKRDHRRIAILNPEALRKRIY